MATLEELCRADVSLKKFNTWRLSGVAEWLAVPENTEQLQQMLVQAQDLPITWLGLGSNVLVRKQGISGVVIVTHPGLTKLQFYNEIMVRVEAGVPCAKLARQSAKMGLLGAEFFIGIPGTMGGALAMNAGAFSGETWSLVRKVEVINEYGEVSSKSAAEFTVSYRQVQGLAPREWFLAAHLRLQPGDSEKSALANKKLLQQRQATQPIGLPSCGSVFRNPPNHHAAALIEACGLKGYCYQGCEISAKHANFIVHRGNGSAAAIEYLMATAQQAVAEKFAVTLQPEVKIIGDS